MNLDDYLKEDTLIGEPIEENQQIETKVEIKKENSKSLGIIGNFSDLKQCIINNFNNGDSLDYVNLEFIRENNIDYFNVSLNDKVNQYIYKIRASELNNYNASTITKDNVIYYKFTIWNADDTIIGFNLYIQKNDDSNCFIEIVPKTGQSTSGGSESEQIDYTEYLEEIIIRIEGVEDGIQDINDNLVSIGNGSGNNNNNEVGSLSQNVISTPLRYYTLTDQIIVIELCIGLFIGLIYVLKRTVFKWK